MTEIRSECRLHRELADGRSAICRGMGTASRCFTQRKAFFAVLTAERGVVYAWLFC